MAVATVASRVQLLVANVSALVTIVDVFISLWFHITVTEMIELLTQHSLKPGL